MTPMKPFDRVTTIIAVKSTARVLLALTALLAAALACALPGQSATSAPTTAVATVILAPTAATQSAATPATAPSSPAKTQVAGTACDLVTAADASLVIDKPPAPTAHSATTGGVVAQTCGYVDTGTGAMFHLTFSTGPKAIAQITSAVARVKQVPGFVQSSANGADLYVAGGPNGNGSDKGDSFIAILVKGETAVSILAGAKTYHYDSAKAIAVFQDIASRLP